MVYVLVDHKVKDYAKWKPVFDKSMPMVKKAGGKSGKLFHVSGEPNHVCVLLEWDTKENATKFFTSEDLKKAFQESGVIGTPMIVYLDKIEDVKI
jgi:uncharacterized protein (DUF1330 family)